MLLFSTLSFGPEYEASCAVLGLLREQERDQHLLRMIKMHPKICTAFIWKHPSIITVFHLSKYLATTSNEQRKLALTLVTVMWIISTIQQLCINKDVIMGQN